jgi:hypothetical protein
MNDGCGLDDLKVLEVECSGWFVLLSDKLELPLIVLDYVSYVYIDGSNLK